MKTKDGNKPVYFVYLYDLDKNKLYRSSNVKTNNGLYHSRHYKSMHYNESFLNEDLITCAYAFIGLISLTMMEVFDIQTKKMISILLFPVAAVLYHCYFVYRRIKTMNELIQGRHTVEWSYTKLDYYVKKGKKERIDTLIGLLFILTMFVLVVWLAFYIKEYRIFYSLIYFVHCFDLLILEFLPWNIQKLKNIAALHTIEEDKIS